MAKNYYQDGDIIDYTATEDVKSGEVVVKGKLIGIAITDIKNGSVGAIQRTGVWTLSKEAGKAFAQGDNVYYDATSKVITSTETDNTLIGIAAYPSVSVETEAQVIING